jgi:molybdopterin-guanine dinucleotide biosynthesis protein A
VSVIAGIFVGGAGSRMGGRAKGMMEAPSGGTIVDRWLAVLRSVGIDRVVLVGQNEAYASQGLEALDDEPAGIGPLGGLCALLRRAGDASALALACDMPFVSSALTRRLLAGPNGPVVAPRRGGVWEPLFARYEPTIVLPIARGRVAAGRHSLQGLLAEAGAVELPLEKGDEQLLTDWDTSEDVRDTLG